MAYRSGRELPAAIGALRQAGIDDLVVVDHGDDGSAGIAAELGARTLSDPANPGYGSGQNRGVAHVCGELLLLANPDALVDAAGIRAGVDFLGAEPGVAAVQGVIVNRATGRPERSAGVPVGPLHLLGRALGARRLLGVALVRRLAARTRPIADYVERIPDGPTDVDSLAATALLIRRSAFEQVGGFDPGYFLYGEDLDLCRRLRLAGWRLVALPDHWAEHTSGASSAGWWNREIVWWEGTLRYGALWWSSREWRPAQVAALLRAAGLCAMRPTRSCEVLTRLILRPARERRRAGATGGASAG